VPDCHIVSMRQEENVYFFKDGDEDTLVGMIVVGGTVEYHHATAPMLCGSRTDGTPLIVWQRH